MAIQKRQFEHLGIMHDQRTDVTVECCQDHYVKQLRLISLDSLGSDEEAAVTDKYLHSSYMSLVGGIRWTLLTRSDVAVHVGYFAT